MRIDIIIVTYNAVRKLKNCIKYIRFHTQNVPYRLIIVDNNSTDGTSKFIKTIDDNSKIIHNETNLGFSGAANIALKSTSGNFIALVDDDTQVTKDWLKKMHKQIEESPDIALVGCKIVSPKNLIVSAEIDVSTNQCLNIGYGEIDKGQKDYIKDVEAINGACWLMRKNIVKQIGLFDEQFYPCQFEDVDYCLRARQEGFRIIYFGKVGVLHHRLLRNGGIQTSNDNLNKFMKKWNNLKDFKNPLRHKDNAYEIVNMKIKYLIHKAFEKAQEEKYLPAIKYLEMAYWLNPRNLAVNHRLTMLYKVVGKPRKSRSHANICLDFFEHRP